MTEYRLLNVVKFTDNAVKSKQLEALGYKKVEPNKKPAEKVEETKQPEEKPEAKQPVKKAAAKKEG